MTTVRWSYTEAKRHAAAISKAKLARWRKTVKAAGLDPNYGAHPNNAMCAYDAGKPWPNVNYSLVRKALWLDRHMFDANRILDRYCRKRDQEDRFWIQADQGRFA